MGNSKQRKKQEEGGGNVSLLEPDQPTMPEPRGAGPSAMAAMQTEAEPQAAATVWMRRQVITGLWSKNEQRNSWVAIRGIGWKKLANTSDSGNEALTLLASQALQCAREIDYREESDGIHEIYLW